MIHFRGKVSFTIRWFYDEGRVFSRCNKNGNYHHIFLWKSYRSEWRLCFVIYLDIRHTVLSEWLVFSDNKVSTCWKINEKFSIPGCRVFPATIFQFDYYFTFEYIVKLREQEKGRTMVFFSSLFCFIFKNIERRRFLEEKNYETSCLREYLMFSLFFFFFLYIITEEY